jgi:hypothetical protein
MNRTQLSAQKEGEKLGADEPKQPLIIVLLSHPYAICDAAIFEGVDVSDNIDSGLASLLRFGVF